MEARTRQFIVDQRNANRGDFADRELDADGFLPLHDDERTELEAAADALWERAKRIPFLHRGGHAIASERGHDGLQWSACSSIVRLRGGKRVFLNCAYESSWCIRLLINTRSLLRGMPAYRPLGPGWKRATERKSLVPPFRWQRKRMIALPLLDGHNGETYLTQRPGEAPRVVAAAMSLLSSMHGAGLAWADAAFANVFVLDDGRVTFLDGETAYVCQSFARQCALDVRALERDAGRILGHVTS